MTAYTAVPGALNHESLLELYINAQPSSLRGLLTRVRDANGLTRESKGPDAVRKFIGHLEEQINPRRVVFVDTALAGESADKRRLQIRYYGQVLQMCQSQVRPATAQAAVAVLATSSPWIQPPAWQADEEEERQSAPAPFCRPAYPHLTSLLTIATSATTASSRGTGSMITPS